MNALAEWLATTGLARFLSQNALAFPVLEIVHVLAISLVLGTVFIFDLRLLGISWRTFPAARLLATLRPFAIVGFAGAVLSGLLLFTAQPVSYLNNFPFQLKLALLAIAGINLFAFHAMLPGSVERWDVGGAIPLPARLSALLSLLLWIAILLAGRFIGFLLQG